MDSLSICCPSPPKCDKCDFVANAIPAFIAHIRTGHTDVGDHCQYCDHVAKNTEYLDAHMYDKHAVIVMLHNMATQINDNSNRFEKFETIKVELGNAIKLLLDTQNSVKQERQTPLKQELLNSGKSIKQELLDSIKSELSLIRNEQTEMSKTKKK